MIDIINSVIGFILTVGLGLIVWESTVMIQEKKMRRKMGITDYYDNPINQVNKNDTIN